MSSANSGCVLVSLVVGFSSFIWDNGYVLYVCIVHSAVNSLKMVGHMYFTFEYLLMKIFYCKHQSKVMWLRDTPGRILYP